MLLVRFRPIPNLERQRLSTQPLFFVGPRALFSLLPTGPLSEIYYLQVQLDSLRLVNCEFLVLGDRRQPRKTEAAAWFRWICQAFGANFLRKHARSLSHVQQRGCMNFCIPLLVVLDFLYFKRFRYLVGVRKTVPFESSEPDGSYISLRPPFPCSNS